MTHSTGTDRHHDNQLYIAYYGDDFTGSTDSMEAMALNGIRTVLFLKPPTPELIESRFSDVKGIGVAGVSRSMTPEQMEQELRPVLETLSELPASIVHYKVCSTFDSSPGIGSIGKAIDIASGVFKEQRTVPLLVGAPILRRYTVFGQHYAAFGDQIFRLDRHPTMSRHPVTPMDEADLRLHLQKQTDKRIANMDILDLDGDAEAVREKLRERLAEEPDIMIYDVLDQEKLARAGQLIWEAALEGDRFVVGSSGVEYAVAAHLQSTGQLSDGPQIARAIGSAGPIIAVSGSCSPVTESQIRYALQHGFEGVLVDAERFIDEQEAEAARHELFSQAVQIVGQGRSPLFYTALGPEDISIRRLRDKLRAKGMQAHDSGKIIGEQLGKLAREVAADRGLRRILVAGGDTSGYVTRELGIYALEVLMRVVPGGPLCRSYSDDPRFDGIQLVLKGGQVGKEDFFVRVLEGKEGF